MKLNESPEATKNAICDHTNEVLYETTDNMVKMLSDSTNNTEGK
jgi:hypothetical protein